MIGARPLHRNVSTQMGRDKARVERDFIEYYTKLGIVAADQAEKFIECLKRPLPCCFRLNRLSKDAKSVAHQLETDFEIEPKMFQNVTITGPKPLEWYPTTDGMGAWQLDCGRVALRKAGKEFDDVKRLHSFVKQHTAAGNISRQEAVSMIPALLLDPKPNQKILDMCAAPGSKTAQLVEAVGQSQTSVVVANDANPKRAHLLVHQIMRIGMMTTAVTNHFGQDFPGLYNHKTGVLETCQVFDRVLCDVPCSGDGTLRKNPAIWKYWHVGDGLTLHPIQIAIAKRAAALLKVSGIMVYSTCTFNPIENEAVIAELLRISDGALELVDCSKELPGLIRQKGLTKWSVGWQRKSKKPLANATVPCPGLQWFESTADVPRDMANSGRLLSSMFPPEKDAENLSRCMRLMPMDQDTGGFFVAVLRKTKALPGPEEAGIETFKISHTPPMGYECHKCGVQNDHYIDKCPEFNRSSAPPTLATRAVSWDKARYQPIAQDHWDCICDFFGISTLEQERIYSRSDGSTSISLVDETVRLSALQGPGLNMINTGTRIFARVNSSDGKLHFRPVQNGLSLLLPHVTKRVMHIAESAFFTILEYYSSVAKPMAYDLLQDPQLVAIFQQMIKGPIILIHQTTGSFAFCVHIGPTSISPGATQQECQLHLDTCRSYV